MNELKQAYKFVGVGGAIMVAAAAALGGLGLLLGL